MEVYLSNTEFRTQGESCQQRCKLSACFPDYCEIIHFSLVEIRIVCFNSINSNFIDFEFIITSIGYNYGYRWDHHS